MVEQMGKDGGRLPLDAKTSPLTKLKQQARDRVMPLICLMPTRQCGQAEVDTIGVTRPRGDPIWQWSTNISSGDERRQREPKAKTPHIPEDIRRRHRI
jgi:hypothetical protein